MPRVLWTFVSLALSLTAGCSNVGEPRRSGSAGPALSIEPFTDGLTAHRPAVGGVNGLVTAGHPLASMAGMQTLMRGGTAADAAVTVLATLNQVEPMMSGAGGNGFMTVYDSVTGGVHSLNATGAAPKALEAGNINADELNRGIQAGVVPGLVGGWIALLERFGTMTLRQVLEPAIEYAEQGHPLDPFVADAIARSRSLIEQYPSTAAVFLPEGAIPLPGQAFTYPDLARTFNRLVEAEETARLSGATREVGLRAAFTRFYRGDIAREMSRFYEEHDGLFTRGDFASYEPVWAEPVHTNYRGFDVYSSPPTSRGGLEVVMQLNLIEGFDVASMGHNSSEALHLIAESIKVAKADIYHFVTDPKHAETPISGLTSKEFAAARRALISVDRAMSYPSAGMPPGVEPSLSLLRDREPGPMFAETSFAGSTTSFSVVDRWGNVVVATPTLGSRWGTGVVVGRTGLLFNNGTRIGSTSPYPDHRNYVRGGQIPILNNSPTLVMKEGKFVFAVGTPGGETIGQTQFQMLLNVFDFGLEIQEAIEAPRLALSADPNFYRSGAELTLRIENRITSSVVSRLVELGHTVELVPPYSLGNTQGILRNPDTGALMAGADPRRMMYAVGW
ncbi:MAG: gamma-glutamyltransferase family protein [Acidobacteriota bacterium]|nr:gamma-glutamyltransferase family protein [Acidobacteriota bacterium]